MDPGILQKHDGFRVFDLSLFDHVQSARERNFQDFDVFLIVRQSAAMSEVDSFGARADLQIGSQTYRIYRLDAVAKAGVGDLATLPYSLRILLENLLRYEDGKTVHRQDIVAVAAWNPAKREEHEVQLRPARVLMQDFTGVPAVCDLAAMRDAFAKLGLDPPQINPLKPAHLVIDH